MDFAFDHERLEVYRVARELNREVWGLVQRLPAGSHESKDNLLRAAKSISRNIAEGSGRAGVTERLNFYNIARASGTECAASLDELVDFGLATERDVREAKLLTWRVVSMLIGLMRSHHNAGPAPPSRRKATKRI